MKVYAARINYYGRDALLSIFEDITDKKEEEARLEENEAQFQAFLRHSKDAYFMHDMDGKLLEVNQYACESLGYTRDELLDLSIEDIDMDYVSGEHKKKWLQMVPGVPVTVEGIHRRKDGTTFPVEVRLSITYA
jgi:PAS domain S-box-containing protein